VRFIRPVRYAWIRDGKDSKEKIRSQDRRLTWPASVTDVLRAFGLLEAARTGTYSGFDVTEDDEEEAEGSEEGGATS